jgi:protein-L-isoaspartate O-methyltransferase
MGHDNATRSYLMKTTAAPTPDRSTERQRMVAFQVAKRGITDQRVIEAMRQVPREAFVGEEMEEFAYEDSPLPSARVRPSRNRTSSL